MINPKRVFPLLCLLLLPLICNGQKWLPGYIVSTQADTTQGLIRFAQDRATGVYVDFRAEGQQEATTYKAEQLAGYTITSGALPIIFKSVALDKEMKSKYGLPNVFAKQLMLGQLDLYVSYPKPEEKPLFYAVKNDSAYFYSFQGVKKLNARTSPKQRVAFDRSLTQFGLLLEDCLKNPYEERLTFKVHNFQKLARAYNECNNSLQYDLRKPKLKAKPFISVQVPVASSFAQSLYPGRLNLAFLSNESRTYSTSNTFAVGAGVEFVRERPGNFIKVGLTVDYFRMDITSDDGVITGTNNTLTAGVYLRREASQGKFRPYALVGARYGGVMNSGNAFTHVNTQGRETDFSWFQSRDVLGFDIEAGIRFANSTKYGLLLGVKASNLGRLTPNGIGYKQWLIGPTAKVLL